MTFRLSRRVFLGTAAAGLVSAAASAKADDDPILLDVHDGRLPWPGAVSSLADPERQDGLLIVGDRFPPRSAPVGPVALVSWHVLGFWPPEALARHLSRRVAVRITAAAERLAAPDPVAWTNLGQLLGLRPPYRRVLVDLGGGGRCPDRTEIADGLAALRAGLGGREASRLRIRAPRLDG